MLGLNTKDTLVLIVVAILALCAPAILNIFPSSTRAIPT